AALRLQVTRLQRGLGHLLAKVAEIAGLLRPRAGEVRVVALEHAHGVLRGEALRGQSADALQLLVEERLLLGKRGELALAAFDLLAQPGRLPRESRLLRAQG